MADTGSGAQLMLCVEAGEGAGERLQAVLAALAVASIVIGPREGQLLAAPEVLGLIAMAQRAGTAALLLGDARLARTTRADGVHLPFAEEPQEGYEAARAIVGGRAIIGADAGRSRHAAMTLGELGADYVAFGVPAFVKDRDTAFERQLDLVAWWSEIFEIPSVAMDVRSREEAGRLAAAGADFVVMPLGFGAGGGIADAVEEARAWAAAIGVRDRA